MKKIFVSIVMLSIIVLFASLIVLTMMDSKPKFIEVEKVNKDPFDFFGLIVPYNTRVGDPFLHGHTKFWKENDVKEEDNKAVLVALKEGSKCSEIVAQVKFLKLENNVVFIICGKAGCLLALKVDRDIDAVVESWWISKLASDVLKNTTIKEAKEK